MRKIDFRLTVGAALLPLVVGGCASQDSVGARAERQDRPVQAPVAGATGPAAAPAQGTRAVMHLPPPSAVEADAGIQVAQVGVTAQGGLVDVRFKVLDAAKARALFADPANVPTLSAEGRPPLTPPHHALKGARFSKGQVFYVLYPNVRGAVQAGTPVMVTMGELRLGPVTAQ